MTAWPVVEQARPGWGRIAGREVLLLCTNDYLGLACDPRLAEAAAAASARFGVGARAARALGGTTSVHEALEAEIAAFKQVEAALTFSSGFAANVGVIPALVGRGDLVLSDELNHASIVDGCRLSRAVVSVYRHADVDDLAARLAARDDAGRALLVTDAVFSMDGRLAPLGALVDRAKASGVTTMVDEAHSTGVYGPGGRGAVAHFGVHAGVDVVIGTLGKALGTVGGYVAGRRELVDHIAGSARSAVFTTAPPPPVAAASLEALRILQREPERVERLWRNARRLHSGLRRLGWAVPDEPSPILPVLIGDDARAHALARALLERDVLVTAVGPPYVPRGTARLRAIVTAAHAPVDIDRALDAFASLAGPSLVRSRA